MISAPDLLYHALTPLGPKGSVRFLPAMLAAVRNDEGILALHRTFLEPKTFRLARFDGPKRALGSLGSGAVRLAMPRGGRLGLAEGIESALSAQQLFGRSEEHTSELQSLMRISYDVFCLQKKTQPSHIPYHQ